MILCASCGNRATAELSRGHVYYHCVNKLGACTKQGIREEQPESRIDRLLQTVELAPTFAELVTEILEDLKKEEVASRKSIAESWQSAVVEVKNQKEALPGLYLRGHLTEEEYAGLAESQAEAILKAMQNSGKHRALRRGSQEPIQNR